MRINAFGIEKENEKSRILVNVIFLFRRWNDSGTEKDTKTFLRMDKGQFRKSRQTSRIMQTGNQERFGIGKLRQY